MFSSSVFSALVILYFTGGSSGSGGNQTKDAVSGLEYTSPLDAPEAHPIAVKLENNRYKDGFSHYQQFTIMRDKYHPKNVATGYSYYRQGFKAVKNDSSSLASNQINSVASFNEEVLNKQDEIPSGAEEYIVYITEEPQHAESNGHIEENIRQEEDSEKSKRNEEKSHENTDHEEQSRYEQEATRPEKEEPSQEEEETQPEGDVTKIEAEVTKECHEYSHNESQTEEFVENKEQQTNHIQKPTYEYIEKPYPVKIIKQVPVRVEVPVEQPVPVIKEIKVPVKVKVDRPVPYFVSKPMPIYIQREIPVPVEKKIMVPFREIIEIPKPYKVPVTVERRVPFMVEKRVPIEMEGPMRNSYKNEQLNIFGEPVSNIQKRKPYMLHAPNYRMFRRPHYPRHLAGA